MNRIFFSLILALTGAFAIWNNMSPSSVTPAPIPSTPYLETATFITPSKPIEQFSLIDSTEKPFSESSLLGHWTLMFFGYATCPDTCPKTLAVISEAWKQLPKTITEDSLRFLFISLNPKTDTPQTLKGFLNRFDSSFVGLTGEPSVIQKLGKSCGIYSWEDPKTQSAHVKIIDHSATLLLLNPQGEIQAFFSPPHEPKAIAEDLKAILKR